MKSFLSLLAVAAALPVLLTTPALAAKPCKFPAVFNFGDSNSDTGGLSAAFGAAQPPNGESYFGKPAGRYCDGRLVIDFIAQGLGLPLISAYLNSLGTNFSHGANFATAGSTITPVNSTLKQSGFSPIYLDVQFNQFSILREKSQEIRKRGGLFAELMPKEEDFANALYTYDIGQNDLTCRHFDNKTVEEVKADIPQIIGQLEKIIRWTYGLGGRNFWIHNTGPVGCLPYVFDRLKVLRSEIDEAGCSSPYNAVAQHFNSELRRMVHRLRKDYTDAAFTYVDVYSLKYAMSSSGKKHGFTQPLTACCGYGGKYNYNLDIGCGGTVTRDGKTVLVGKSCSKPTSHVNWDGVHYTQAANKYIYEHIMDGSFSDPPIPLNMACRRSV